MLHTKSQGHGRLVPEMKIFKGFLTIYGRGGHLGHVTSTIDINFYLTYHKESSYEI